jgi:hypothetical protein
LAKETSDFLSVRFLTIRIACTLHTDQSLSFYISPADVMYAQSGLSGYAASMIALFGVALAALLAVIGA